MAPKNWTLEGKNRKLGIMAKNELLYPKNGGGGGDYLAMDFK
jgi:hypothetical protein